MSKRIVGLLAVALLMFCASAALSQIEQAHPVYTYVSDFQVPRANWAEYADEAQKNADQRLCSKVTLSLSSTTASAPAGTVQLASKTPLNRGNE